ncbi:MAG: DUF3667 domain-containing protein [Sphingorhabdus sp.]
MSDELAGAGDILTGAVIARAVEPEAGEGRVSGHPDCLNCGATLAGVHCHHCGQKAQVHRTLHAFGHDILHSVLHFDGKIWRTLPMLAWRPGELTRRYVHGERANFVSPLALFLFTVFLMFAVFSWVLPNDIGPNTNINVTQANQQLIKGRAKVAEEIGRLQAKREAAMKDGSSPTEIAEIDKDIVSAQTGLKFMGKTTDAMTGGIKGLKFDFFGDKSLNEAFEHAVDNPQLLAYKVQSNAYKFSWALIPISVPFLWLLFFWRRQFKLFDHAVFITYSLSFMMLLGIIGAVLVQFPATQAIGVLSLVFVPPNHMYRQLRQAYETSRFGAFWRMCALSLFALTALSLFAALIVTLGVTG